MDKIGLDFGTTNTTLCYIEKGEPIPFQFGGASGKTYIPSYLAIDTTDPEEKIVGHAALRRVGDPGYRIFSRFKMLLNSRGDELKARGFDADYSPRNVATWFFEQLIRSYKEEKGVHKLSTFVITVPEIWVREGRQSAREDLKKICVKDLKLPLAKILSEPEAACVYFAWKHKQLHAKDFNGHVLIFDYGGGTLDLSLASLEKEKITILESVGVGRLKNGQLGKAGVAYDESVLSNLYQKAGKEREEHEWARHLKEFEEDKIDLKADLDKRIDQYLKNPATDKRIFSVGSLEVWGKDLVEAFSPFRAEVERSLIEMQDVIKQQGVDTSSGDTFRVLMVGGFSQFYLAARAVRDFYSLQSSADRRFNSGFDLVDTALAIAKGAALVANGSYEIERLCPISVGVQVRRSSGVAADVILLQHGRKISDYKKPVYSDSIFQVCSADTPLNIFLEVGTGGRRRITLGKINQFFPAGFLSPRTGSKDFRNWKIGFSVDEDEMFTMHVREYDRVNNKLLDNEKTTPLGDLERHLEGIFVVDEAG